MPWAIIQSQPCSADDDRNPVARRLLRQNFQPYNPRYVNRRKQPEQLFPGYMFVSGVGHRWSALRTTEGVRNLLTTGPEKPALLPDRVVEGLRSCEAEQGLLSLAPKFSPTDQVQIVAGPFAAAIGLYEGQRQRDRVSVLLGLMRVFVREDNLVAC